jgi:hypothetical protein
VVAVDPRLVVAMAQQLKSTAAELRGRAASAQEAAAAQCRRAGAAFEPTVRRSTDRPPSASCTNRAALLPISGRGRHRSVPTRHREVDGTAG